MCTKYTTYRLRKQKKTRRLNVQYFFSPRSILQKATQSNPHTQTSPPGAASLHKNQADQGYIGKVTHVIYCINMQKKEKELQDSTEYFFFNPALFSKNQVPPPPSPGKYHLTDLAKDQYRTKLVQEGSCVRSILPID